MIEIKDECEYCGRKKKDHFNGSLNTTTGFIEMVNFCLPNERSLTYKSTTEALAEKNGLKNLEVMEKQVSNLYGLHDLFSEMSISEIKDKILEVADKLSQAIKESTI